MTTDIADRHYFSVEDAAAILEVSPTTLTSAIDAKRIPAQVLTGNHRATRISRAVLFPHEVEPAKDLRDRRMRRLVLAAKDAREMAERKRHEWLVAQEAADAAQRAIEDEIGLIALDELVRKAS